MWVTIEIRFSMTVLLPGTIQCMNQWRQFGVTSLNGLDSIELPPTSPLVVEQVPVVITITILVV